MSLLRTLIERARPEAEKVAGEGRWLTLALATAARRFLLIGGTVSLSDELSEAEVVALEEARERLEVERLEALAEALQAPKGLGKAVARARLDGGAELAAALHVLWAAGRTT
jgi:hypothetical protein